MSLSIQSKTTERVPLTLRPGGVVLVEGTRVALDTVVEAFNAGSSAEEIALGYPTLELADVYAVIAYYLHHRPDVDDYVADRRREADTLRERIESHYQPRDIRERLLARRSAQQS